MRERRETYTSATHTRARVAFLTDEANGFNTDRPVAAHSRLGRIVSVSTAKQLGSASGTFTITIKKDQQYHGPRSALRDLWRDPEDVWVRIEFVVDGQVIDTMIGLIDTVRENVQRTGGGQRSETYTIVGRDIGKVFETTELFVNVFHNPDNPVRAQGALVASYGERIVGTPAHFVHLLVDEWVGNNGAAEAQFALPRGLGGGYFYGILQKHQIQPMASLEHGEALAPNLFQIDQTTGKLWDVMQEYSNGALNEMFVDLAPPPGRSSHRDHTGLKPTLFLRERPFPIRSDDGRTTVATQWHGLTSHVLEPQDVMTRDIAKGGAANRYNYWLLLIEGLGTEGFNVAEILQRGVEGVPYGHPGNIPVFDTASIQRHGLRRYSAHTRFIPFWDSTRQAQFFRLCARWLKKIHDWFSVAPLELSGRIVTSRVFPEIRIGQRVIEQRREGRIVYYCEGVEHSWTYPNAGSTSLTLTRGEYEGDDLLAHVYAGYANPPALSAAEICMTPISDLTDAEVDDFLRAECRVDLPTTPRAQVLFENQLTVGAVSEGEGFAVTGAARAPRVLAAERDGTVPYVPEGAQSDPGMSRALDSAEPSVGTEEAIPTPNDAGPAPGEPVLSREALERGEPIEVSDDPLYGLTDEELSGF